MKPLNEMNKAELVLPGNRTSHLRRSTRCRERVRPGAAPAARMRTRGDAGEGAGNAGGELGHEVLVEDCQTWESIERENGVFRDSGHASKCLLVIPPGRQQPAPAGELDCAGTPGTSALTLDDVTGYFCLHKGVRFP